MTQTKNRMVGNRPTSPLMLNGVVQIIANVELEFTDEDGLGNWIFDVVREYTYEEYIRVLQAGHTDNENAILEIADAVYGAE